MKIFLYLILILSLPQNNNFLNNQLKYARVRTAKAQKNSIVKDLFLKKNLEYPSNNIFIRVFKSESILELWAYDKKPNNFIKVKTYTICALSGKVGPKKRRGDLQIPEGFYHISQFNPVSNFYLSLKINYPNDSDKILGFKTDLGGDIFIHGDCVTIGCMPITNDFIKELYWIVVQARSNGQEEIPVHIFPARLNEIEFNQIKKEHEGETELIKFWNNLKEGYDYFEKYNELPKIDIQESGKYIFLDNG